MFEWLLDHGANPNATGDDGYTPFHEAVFGKDVNIVSLMIRHGADVNRRVICDACSTKGDLPLYLVRDGLIAEALLAAGADVKATRYTGLTALHETQAGAVARALIAHGANVNARTPDGWTPLMLCMTRYEPFQNLKTGEEYRQIAEALVRNGADLRLKNTWNRDALSYTTDESFKAKLRGIVYERR